ncbi:adenylosuccinate synthetase [candidate division MSBL1 archaeon SCGC-AAA833F18]|uniref:Adenylosuccinate synthetase n=3 Tax=candidate division MSBL1 TaxID=215777 RepID=A0A133VSV3_9EURY|nr:adenylosuccinate synthetase [candidate division MSBL1 archaeon SCGC-AAA261F17]KXB04908.1 adenylosuccinate synthetase [candidate division MSBL1 archaeon SCGC-AAA261O19]KXB09539.1 adenylosuccinate synthetase [candidate division MSBL1 archaeon SCGC-AAA833F18]
MPCTIIAGGQWGDEGKGKIAAYLALTDKPKIIARAGVGPNAGHTVVWKGEKLGLREISCGFVHEGARVLIGPGVLVNPEVVLDEIEKTEIGDRMGIDRKCAIIEQKHIEQDRSSKHLKGEIGTTGTGCGPANAERVNRSSKLAEEIEELKEFLTDVPQEVNVALEKGERVFIEGSQGFGLSLIHGTFPYVTSKDISASTLAADVGVGPTNVDEVLLIFKAYISRVGAGPFPTEMPLEKAEEMGIVEHGTVTGRRRRIGEFDFDLAKRSIMINGATQLAITNVDRLFDGNKGIQKYDKLTKEARDFIEKIESEVNVPVTLVSTGPKTEDIIDLRSEKL